MMMCLMSREGLEKVWVGDYFILFSASPLDPFQSYVSWDLVSIFFNTAPGGIGNGVCLSNMDMHGVLALTTQRMFALHATYLVSKMQIYTEKEILA